MPLIEILLYSSLFPIDLIPLYQYQFGGGSDVTTSISDVQAVLAITMKPSIT